MRDIDKFIIHASSTTQYQDYGVDDIRKWHLKRGWSDIGYHYVIRRDGTVEVGRPVEKAGAHCRGHNEASIGICLVGGMEKYLGEEHYVNNFTFFQGVAISSLVLYLQEIYGYLPIYGHKDLIKRGTPKACPCFEIDDFIKSMFF